MRYRGLTRSAATYGIVGSLAGGLAAVATISIVASAIAQSTPATRGVLDVTHSPALLRAPSDPAQLVYDAHCAATGVEDPEAPCHVAGSVFVREPGSPTFRDIPLEQVEVGRARLEASLPGDLVTRPALEYFAVITSQDARATVTVPAAGAAAPTVSHRLDRPVSVALGRHRFGEAQRVGEQVASAHWGDGPYEIGLEEGRTSNPIGASSFDVAAGGSVVVLDHANRKLLRWSRGSRQPERTPVSVNGTIADIAVAQDGSYYVLETTSRDDRNPLVRRFDDAGRELEAVETAEGGPAQILMGPDGPLVLQRPSHHWMPVLVAGVPASQAAQRSRGRGGRRLQAGGEVVVHRVWNELRLALLVGGSITRSWRITSETPLGEVQLAERLGDRFVVVLRIYDDHADEFAVLQLDRHGLRSRTYVASAEWAEGAPLGRFRVAGTQLYRLGTSPSGVFVDRFSLEVR